MKISADKKFAMFDRCNANSKENWVEILNLTKISAVKEYRYGKGVYNNAPGRRQGYLVFVEGGDENGFWINDKELQILFNEGIFGKFNDNH